MNGFQSALVGDGLLLVACAEVLAAKGHGIALVASSNPQVRAWAEGRAIPICDPEGMEDKISDCDFDWLFSIANLRLLPPQVLNRARLGAINFHDALLPEQAGLNTPAWAILEGHRVHGVTWHAMTDEIDAGDIYAQASFEIAEDETAFTLNSKCFEAGLGSFADLVTAIADNRLSVQRPASPPVRIYRQSDRPPAAATLDFSKTAAELDRLVRALDFGQTYGNPLATAKIRHGSAILHVAGLTVLDGGPAAEPGTILAVEGGTMTVATADRPVLLSIRHSDETPNLRAVSRLQPGEQLMCGNIQERADLTGAVSTIARFEPEFRVALRQSMDVALSDIGNADAPTAPDLQAVPLTGCEGMDRGERIALVCAFIARLSEQTTFDIAFSSDRIADFCAAHPGYFSPSVPLKVEASDAAMPREITALVERRLNRLDRQITYLSDLRDRYPDLPAGPLTCAVIDARMPTLAEPVPGCALNFRIGTCNSDLLFDRNRIDESHARSLARKFAVFAPYYASNRAALVDLPILDEEERKMVLFGWNDTQKGYEDNACVHQLIERQVRITPDAEALSSGGRSLTYRELNEQAENVAACLLDKGIGPDVIVGLHLSRTVDLVVAALGIWKAGGAYLALDPEFPADRLSFMIEDSQTKLVISSRDLSFAPALASVAVVTIEEAVRANKASAPRSNATSDHLAYVIYTSGSTGLPKGVMVEHRNVVNFFAGMDERVPVLADRRNVWLAVTSLSFDISVLELFWTLARGFKVVIHTPETHQAKANAKVSLPTDFSFGLFYWGNDASAGSNKYRLLIEGAKFADENGFDAIWTPERHFHAFGGPFPNPAVTGAAVAAVTKNLSIRAGSCVLPLHHPIRVAEEWAVVDNLSNGRVGIAVASGWMPEDFVLRPENAPPHNKAKLLSDIDVLRKLWRGEDVSFDLGAKPVQVLTQPRPVQKELPIWLTIAGNPESYKEAARAGAHVLTHLLGQSIDELAEKIALYRTELAHTGRNPSDYKVTLMLHTLIGEGRDQVQQQARGPMKDYLKSAAALIKQYAWAFPAFKKPHGISQPMDIDLRTLEAEEMDAILEFAFQRYFNDSGLFGTIEDALARLQQVKAVGVDEIACLIDWGLPEDLVLDGLIPLAAVVEQARHAPEIRQTVSFAAEVANHEITHLQATPSMMRGFMMSDDDRTALGQITHILIGGEALHGSLVAALKTCTQASVENMYGPTETTIWSSTFTARTSTSLVPIGRPIANTQLYVLDGHKRPVAPGDAGELYIGGDGVARGYLNRDELTRERFFANPFAAGRIYRTGDVARFDETGTLHFLGRNDQQVKIRGYRIELGEIESQIASFPGILEAVVTARKDQAGGARLAGYIRVENGIDVCETKLRDHLKSRLPEAMIPTDIVTLDTFPLTPNAKVDRNRLPAPSARAPVADLPFIAPAGDIEEAIGSIFARLLGRAQIGRQESFFALGGHSLLAVQMHRELKASIAPALTVTDVFRFPTVATLAEHISGKDSSVERLSRASDRATQRRQAMQERQSRTSRNDALV
ncbi:LLM class flavin-dependent oxidoreductase [Neorhizobium sp. T786]|uniref:MupA/Atu3671 family FMN-dependent luciferase-like monooxygenase n=1 Tax=Pseudorhizobium xiangyangii TaxID=2883104 RepID=UPI001D000ECC|nr:MupA/Atu3671 family FMN-dependent luciferase-like monooxygenase [Neorhizobium xiangyangii]MCB5204661.1 LLM class flavin-dependent oxidoreductase [Neorhizobium xiangyangii]